MCFARFHSPHACGLSRTCTRSRFARSCAVRADGCSESPAQFGEKFMPLWDMKLQFVSSEGDLKELRPRLGKSKWGKALS